MQKLQIHPRVLKIRSSPLLGSPMPHKITFAQGQPEDSHSEARDLSHHLSLAKHGDSKRLMWEAKVWVNSV